MSKPVQVTAETFDREVLEADLPVLVDFWASWCGPCRMIAPVLDDLAREYTGRMKIVKVDVDGNPGLARRFQVMSIPTLGLFRKGRLVKRLFGYMSQQELRHHLEAAWGDGGPGTAVSVRA